MNKVTLQVIFNSIRSRKDGSLGISLETPELTVEDKVEVMKLQNQVLQGVFIPIDSPNAPAYKVDKEIEQKSPSTRLRNVLYVWWEQLGTDEDFDSFYRRKMEQFIERVKAGLDG